MVIAVEQSAEQNSAYRHRNEGRFRKRKRPSAFLEIEVLNFELLIFSFWTICKAEMQTDCEKKETELVERALQICRSKYANALSRRAEINKEIEYLEGKIRNYEQLTASTHSALIPNSSINRKKRTPRGRIPHNHCELLFAELLQARDGIGATLKELIELTGASVATGYRTIGRLEQEKKVKQDDDARWHWIKK